MASTSRFQSEVELRNTFSVLASASPFGSSPSQDPLYDIFINHHAPDVKFILARPLDKVLHSRGFRTFLNSETPNKVNCLPREVKKAMVSAHYCIAIFSPGYAQSASCLSELSFLVNSGKPIFPVLYRVNPSDLRWAIKGRGMYANAFWEHEQKGNCSADELKMWKDAIHKVSFVNGIIINENDDHQDVLKNIENLLPGIRKGFEIQRAVGLEEVVEGFETIVSKSQNTPLDAQIVGICGAGGSGKTTLAKELFNQYHLFIKRSSVIFDVKGGKLHKMQSELLQTLGFSSHKINDHEKGNNILPGFLMSAPVFIVLDDVDHIDQLDALLPGTVKDNLKQGSLIIVTSRDRGVLRSWGISCIYEMKKMKPSDAKELFCWHAFSEPSSPSDCEELVQGVVNVCDGLPSSLVVLGDQLKCFDEGSRKGALHEFSKIVPSEIRKRLNVIYDALDEQEKHMFLDLACFLNGKDKRTAFAVWEGSECNHLCGWESLFSKCLVYLDSNNCIRMHAHSMAFGREIAEQQLHYRLLSPSQLTHINEHIRGILLDAATNEVHNNPSFLLKTCTDLCGFRRPRCPPSVGLEVLFIRGNCQNSKHVAKLSRALIWLSWSDSTLRNLPSWLLCKNLRVLELHRSQFLGSLWKSKVEAPLQLRVLIICDCPNLANIPKSIRHLCSLKKIVIEGSNHLRTIEIFPTAVEYIQVKDCKSLWNINGISNLVGLQVLMLSGCPVLDVLPSFSNLASLGVFEMIGVNKVKRIPGLQHCTSLEKLTLNCQSWKQPEVLGIECLEHMQNLKRLQLVADKRAAVEPCIQMFLKWTEEIIVCSKAVPGAGSLLDSSVFPKASYIRYFADKKISHVASHFLSFPQKLFSNDNAILLCLVIQCLSPHMKLVIKVGFCDTLFSTEVEEGKWILIGVFKQNSRPFTAQGFYIHQERTETHQQLAEDGEVEKGLFMTGEEPLIMVALQRLLELLEK